MPSDTKNNKSRFYRRSSVLLLVCLCSDQKYFYIFTKKVSKKFGDIKTSSTFTLVLIASQ